MTKQKRKKAKRGNQVPLTVHGELAVPKEILPWELDLLPLVLEQAKEIARIADGHEERGR
ncbi:MAG: hypothetical protein GY847_01150 [Proteobacteria bacterium]|nr:hypothetical protein [Pseudomonadota bacterium]